MRRQINKLLIHFCIVIMSSLSFISFAHANAQQNNPVSLLQYIANNMIAGLKANKATLKSKPSIVYGLANQYVVPYADLTVMSKRVLPPAIWNGASAAQRAEFQKAFTTTLVRTYASALTSYQDQIVKFYPVRGGFQNAHSVEVQGEIIGGSGRTIHVTYRLTRLGSAWRLYDMSVEGVSMLESFRAQFSDILAQGNMEKLLQRLGNHNQRIMR